MKELQAIQSKLKVSKGQTNKFGNYKYRSCEDILEALKPLLDENGCVLTISDEIIFLEGRFYVKATVELRGQTGSVIVSAFARESESMKGFDVAQLTGSASSYARKYALNGLFCIDDTKDADTQDNTKEGPKMPTRASINKRLGELKTEGEYDEAVKKFSEKYGKDFWEKPSGHPTKKEETWSNLFKVHNDRIMGIPPVDANTSPSELQISWTNTANDCEDRATYNKLEIQLNQNRALDIEENWAELERINVKLEEDGQ